MNYASIIGIVLIFVVMYMLMIRPQKKREKQINEMRSSLKVGDKITTIGGIKGKIMSLKDDSLIIQVGSTKLEVMRWAISKVDSEETAGTSKAADTKSSAKDEEEEKAASRKPKKLTAKSEEKASEDKKADAKDKANDKSDTEAEDKVVEEPVAADAAEEATEEPDEK